MKVSVITVVRNDRDGLAETIASVRSQSYSSLEFIVIDGGSNDGTVNVIRSNVDIIDYWSSESDDGIYDAMNKGLERATGEFVLFLNAGDRFLTPTSLGEAATTALQNPQADLLYFRAVGENGRSVSSFESKSALRFDSVGNHQAVFVRVAVHRRFLFDTRYRIKADRDVQLRMYLNGCQMEEISEAITCFRAGGVSTTAIATKEWENILVCWRNHVGVRWTLNATCLALARVSLNLCVQVLGLNWDTTKRRFLAVQRPQALRAVLPNSN